MMRGSREDSSLPRARLLCVLDEDWRIGLAEPTLARLLGRSLDEIFSRSVWELVPQAVASGLDREAARARAGGVPVRIEEFWPAADARIELELCPANGQLAVFARQLPAASAPETNGASRNGTQAVHAPLSP